MLTEQHLQSIRLLVGQGDAGGLHQLLHHLPVADRKRGKSVLSGLLADRSVCTLEACLRVCLQLLSLDLNLYFNLFLNVSGSLRREDDFWEASIFITGLGRLLSGQKVYYRRQVLTVWLASLPEHRSVEQVFDWMQVKDVRVRIAYLLECGSVYALYLIFRMASHADVDTEFLSKCVRRLLVPAPDAGLPTEVREDVANFLCHYFNGLWVKYPFRRKLDASTFSYAEKSYEAFLQIVIPPNRLADFCRI